MERLIFVCAYWSVFMLHGGLSGHGIFACVGQGPALVDLFWVFRLAETFALFVAEVLDDFRTWKLGVEMRF